MRRKEGGGGDLSNYTTNYEHVMLMTKQTIVKLLLNCAVKMATFFTQDIMQNYIPKGLKVPL